MHNLTEQQCKAMSQKIFEAREEVAKKLLAYGLDGTWQEGVGPGAHVNAISQCEFHLNTGQIFARIEATALRGGTAYKVDVEYFQTDEPESIDLSDSYDESRPELSFEKSGVELIREERKRHLDEEGWTSVHDDAHKDGQLAYAASVYARVTNANVIEILRRPEENGWPWDRDWFKPFEKDYQEIPAVDRKRCLIKAGALIAAELDRLNRKE